MKAHCVFYLRDFQALFSSPNVSWVLSFCNYPGGPSGIELDNVILLLFLDIINHVAIVSGVLVIQCLSSCIS